MTRFLIVQVDWFSIIAAVATALVTLLGGGTAVYFIFFRQESTRRWAEANKAEIEAASTSVDLSFKWTQELENVRDLLQSTIDKKQQQLDEAETEIDERKKKEDVLLEKLKLSAEEKQIVKRDLRQHIIHTRRLFHKLKLAYWETDHEGNLVFVSGEWLKIFGIPPAEAKEKKWKRAVSDSDIDRITQESDRMIVDMSDNHMPVFEVTNLQTNEVYKVRAVYVSIFKDNGTLLKSYGITEKI